MLVLTRKIGEVIIIKTPDGQTIKIAVVKIKGSQVKIGVEADRETFLVLREELYKQKTKKR